MAGEQTTEQVIIQFTTDVTQLESANDVLERTGQVDKKLSDSFKKTNAEITKQQQAIKAVAKEFDGATKKEVANIEQLRAEMQQFVTDFVTGFSEGIVEEIKNAGFEFDEFGKIVNKGGQAVKKETTSLRGELRDLTAQLALMKDRGEDNTQEFFNLARRAGEVRDAIGDANAQINNFASDTRQIDGLINLTSALAGGFALVQGATALFGDESEELQETLLNVNAAMAVLQGFQQVSTVLQAESAAATFLQTTAQKAYNLVVGESIGIMKAFRIALALTGVGVFILLIGELVSAFSSASDEAAKLNNQLERNRQINDANAKSVEALTAKQIALAEEAGAKESDLIRIRGQSINRHIDLLQASTDELVAQRAALDVTSEGYAQLNQAIQDNNDAIDALNTQAAAERIKLNIQLRKEELQAIADNAAAELAGARKNTAEELKLARAAARARAAVELYEAGQNAAQRRLIEANLRKELLELDLNYQRTRQQNLIAGLEAQLTDAQQISRRINARTSQEEIDLQKRIIQENARLELLQEGLTENQKLNIQKQSLAQQAELQREFNQNVSRETLEDFISRNNRQLAELNLSATERLRLTEENIIAQAEIEIEAAQGLSDRIKEIEAKRDADIRALRLQTIQSTLQYELDADQARTGVLRRTQERILSLEATTLQQRIAAINQLTTLDISALNKRQDALEEQHNKSLISEQDYLLQYAQLQDEEARITEEAEARKLRARQDAAQRTIAIAIQAAGQVLDIIRQAGDDQLEAQQAQIDAQRQQVSDLLEAGNITEREAAARQKRLDVEERRLRRQQAQREKDFATFKAFLAIPQAYLLGLAQGGPILAALYAALAAAQAIAIAARPIPKFGKGKKDSYQGPGEVGETGPEILQSGDSMYYIPKRTLVWIGKKDKVFNPAETQRMLEKPTLKMDNTYTNSNVHTQHMVIDYAKLGKEVGRNIPRTGFNFDKEGITQWVQGATSLEKYLDKRRSY